MKIVRDEKIRLKNRDCHEFFTKNSDLFNSLKLGKVIEIPDNIADKIINIFGKCIKIIKDNDKKIDLKKVIDGGDE